MRHLTEDELVLHRYGESENPSEAAHLSECRQCRENLDRLVAELGLLDRLPVPPRGESYGREVWQRVRLCLAETEPARRPPFAAHFWVLSGSLAALLAAAFLAGRFWPRGAAPAAAGVPSESRERILLFAVADHLDRSQIVLLEFLHSDPSRAEESDRERRFAEELVSANRLYRQTASQSGEAGMAGTLESLERVLLEIAHTPSPDAREALKRRIESEGILFKLRIVRSELGRREKASAPPPAVRS
jgi:hypothetical protein